MNIESLLNALKKIKLAQLVVLVCLGFVLLKQEVSLYIAVILSLSLLINVIQPWIPVHNDKVLIKIKELELEMKNYRTELSKLNLVFGVSRGESFVPRREEKV